jgi:hypothetical protein
MSTWLLKRKVIGSTRLMASATWQEIVLAEGLHDWETRLCPSELHPTICLTTEEEHGQQVRVVEYFGITR